MASEQHCQNYLSQPQNTFKTKKHKSSKPYPEVVGPTSELLESLVNVVGVEGVIAETQEEGAGVLPDHIVWKNAFVTQQHVITKTGGISSELKTHHVHSSIGKKLRRKQLLGLKRLAD